MAPSSRPCYAFEAFRLDPVGRVLYRGNEPVPLTLKAVETLLVLVERHGQVVTKDEILRIVWPDTFVEDNNLAQHISTLRRVLGDSGGRPVIETVPKRGYRFVARVAEGVASGAGAVFEPATGPTTPPSAPGTALQSIAVMPFDEVGLDQARQYSGDGIADELTTQLGRESRLKVAARTSAFALKGRQLDAREIGRTLNVDALLEGSVLQRHDRVRVAVRVVNTRDGYQIWSNTWDQSVDGIPAIQDQILVEVLQVFGGGRSRDKPAAASAPAVAPEAYHLYLQARYLWHQRTRDSLQRSAELFERATVLSPDYAQAFSGLADAYAVLGFYDYLPPGQAFSRAAAAAQRALALDARLAHAHASLGYVALYHDWNWAAAEAGFERAIALNPSYSVGHQWYANYLTARGRFAEAVAAMRRAQEVDPLSLVASAGLGWVHFYQREYDAAVEQCRRTLDLNPRFELAHLWAGWAYEAAGRYAESVHHLGEAVRLSSESAGVLASLGRAQALAGDRTAARQTLARLTRTHGEYLPAFEVAKLHLALEDGDQAIAWLRRALAERSHSIVFLSVDPQLDRLREDPRFVELESRMAAAPRTAAASRGVGQ